MCPILGGRVTWEEEDLVSAFEAARLIQEDSERSEMAQKIITGIALHASETYGSPAFEAIIHTVAKRLTNERWKRLLLKKAEEHIRPFR